MSTKDNTRRNASGNVEDDADGSWYVLDANDDEVAGPFGTASYAHTVKNRLEGQGFHEPLDVDYEPDGPRGVDDVSKWESS